ncbi:MAG: hypothetical protein AB8G11_26035 [Saprospiraceae bacterium]
MYLTASYHEVNKAIIQYRVFLNTSRMKYNMLIMLNSYEINCNNDTTSVHSYIDGICE